MELLMNFYVFCRDVILIQLFISFSFVSQLQIYKCEGVYEFLTL